MAGLLGGMGMGGGTVFIPMLTEAFGVEQHLAQWVNLVAFVPMAAASLAIHAKNGLVDKKGLWLIVPSAASSVGFSFLAVKTSSKLLGLIFACFLILMGLSGVVSSVVKARKDRIKSRPHEPPD